MQKTINSPGLILLITQFNYCIINISIHSFIASTLELQVFYYNFIVRNTLEKCMLFESTKSFSRTLASKKEVCEEARISWIFNVEIE